MTTRKPLFAGAELGSEEMATTDDMVLGGLAMGGDIVMGTNEVTGLPAIPSATGAASKEYVEALLAGIPPRASVKLATAAALPAYTASLGPGVGRILTADAVGILTVDGVASVLGDYILVKDEGAADADHGVFEHTTEGTAGVAFVLTRRTDLDEDDEVFDGITIWVGQGATQADTRWTIATNDNITVDTTPIAWTQTGGPGAVTGGDGIDVTGSVVKVDLDTDAGLEFDSALLQVKLNGTTLSRAAAGMAVVGLPALFEVATVAVGSDVTAANLTTLADGSNADALHVHASGSAGRLEDEMTAFEILALGDAVEFGGANNEIRECQADVDARIDAMGIVEEAGGIGAAAVGTVVHHGIAVGVIAAATVGQRFFVDDGGGIVQGFGGLAAGSHVIFVGQAVNATDLFVKCQYITKKAA